MEWDTLFPDKALFKVRRLFTQIYNSYQKWKIVNFSLHKTIYIYHNIPKYDLYSPSSPQEMSDILYSIPT